MFTLTRRLFLSSSPMLFAGTALDSQAPPGSRFPAQPSRSFPSQDPELVRETVGVSHGNLARVKELLAGRPSLARATWDWGFGDWESALGAASHVGNRAIAELLLANGARPSIFSAAMLGQLAVVRAFIEASPGIQRTKGPHGFTLLHHATVGGGPSAAVVDYLKSVGGADEKPALQPLTPEDIDRLRGRYRFGAPDEDEIQIGAANGSLTFLRTGRVERFLSHIGGFEFFPAGVEHARIAFTATAEGMRLTVRDPDVVLVAMKIG
jgi:hypothetical protein